VLWYAAGYPSRQVRQVAKYLQWSESNYRLWTMRAAGLFVWLAGSCQHLGGLSHLFPSPPHSLCSLTLPLSSHLHSCPTIRFAVVYLPYNTNNIVAIHLFFFDILFYFVSPVMFNLFRNFYYIAICSQILYFSFALYFNAFRIQNRFLYISISLSRFS